MLTVVTKTDIDKYSLSDYSLIQHERIRIKFGDYRGSLSRDGSTGIFPKSTTEYLLLDTKTGTGNSIHFTENNLNMNTEVISPDGSVMAIMNTDDRHPSIQLMEIDSEEIISEYRDKEITDSRLWSSDGSGLFYVRKNGTVVRLNVETMEISWTSHGIYDNHANNGVRTMACSDDDSVLMITTKHSCTTIDSQTGEIIRIQNGEFFYDEMIIISPDNRFFAFYTYEDSIVDVYTMSDNAFQHRIRIDKTVLAVGFNPDSESLTVVTIDGIYSCEPNEEPRCVVPLEDVKGACITPPSSILM
jgi:hypothetical protein